MLVIHINDTTQQYIADYYNDGVVPQLGKDDPDANGEDTYFLVGANDEPNRIVTSETYYTKYFDESDTMINVIPR